MDRRAFFTGFFGAAVGLALGSGSAVALTIEAPLMPTLATPPEAAVLDEHDGQEASVEKVGVYYRRVYRVRRRVVVRRRYYRPRYYRPRYYHRPRYYRPRYYRRRYLY